MLDLKVPSLNGHHYFTNINYYSSCSQMLSSHLPPHKQTNKQSILAPIFFWFFVYIVSQFSYCSYFSLFYSESLSLFMLWNSKLQSQIFNRLFIKWLPTMWQAGDAVILSPESRANHLYLNSKTSNPKLSLLLFTNVTSLVLPFALLLMSSWLSNTLMLAGFPEKQTLKRSAWRKLIRECSWDPYPWKSGEGSKIGKREKLDCDTVSWRGSVDPTWSSNFRVGWIRAGSLEWGMTLGKAALLSPGNSCQELIVEDDSH